MGDASSISQLFCIVADIEALAAEIRGAKNTMRDWRTGGAVVVLIGGGLMALIAQSEKFAAFFRKFLS
jgi:hypothetical protein